MITATVIDPLSIVDATAAMEPQLVHLLRGIAQNGIVLRDNNSILGRGIQDCALAKQSVLVREMLINVYQNFAFETKIPPKTALDEALAAICKTHSPDLVITERIPFPANLEASATKAHSLGKYHISEAEALRVSFCQGLPPIDELGLPKFSELLRRTTRLSKWLRIYDPYLAKGEGESRFRLGLAFVLQQWRQKCCHPQAECSVDLISVDYGSDKGRSRLEAAIKEIQKDISVLVRVILVKDPDSLFHARHLETKEFIVQVDPGFDFFKSDNTTLKRILLKPARGDRGHLTSLRRLEKAFEKSYPAP